VDINESGVRTAKRLAEAAGMGRQAVFEQCDVSNERPFADAYRPEPQPTSRSPPGVNEQFIERAGFRVLAANDTTGKTSPVAKRWHDARDRRREALIAIEGEANFEGLQRFLSCAHSLTAEMLAGIVT
jgi:hypothetical protein